VPFIWLIHVAPFDEYRYTPYPLTRELKAAGFVSIRIEPLACFHAALAQVLGVWALNVRWRTKGLKKRIARFIEATTVLPFISFLLRKDAKVNDGSYGNDTFPTGFVGLVRKTDVQRQ